MPTISLCMIIKNEKAVLARALESAAGIADEIILVDTGSTDGTKKIAGKYTDKLYDFPWREDFAAARNFACEKAAMDYWMWLDADDVITKENRELFFRLKENLSPDTDAVMMKYCTDFDDEDRCTFSYYRERLMKRSRAFRWQGRVHEAVEVSGHIHYSPIEIHHRKLSPSEPGRNLRIYRAMAAAGERFSPRQQYYYGRELSQTGLFLEAAAVLESFLREPEGWIENRIDACLQLSRCYRSLGKKEESLAALFNSFLYGPPRGEICCEIGSQMLEAQDYPSAIHWYRQALRLTPPDHTGAFVQPECYDFLPAVWLCVCHDRLGERKLALRYHRLAKALRPKAPAVLHNEDYFRKTAH